MKKTARKILSLCMAAAMVMGMTTISFAAPAKTYELKTSVGNPVGTISVTDVVSDSGMKEIKEFDNLGKIQVTKNSLITYNFVTEGVGIWQDAIRIWDEEEIIKIINAKVIDPTTEYPEYEKGYTIQFIKEGTYLVGVNGQIGDMLGAGLYAITFEVTDTENATTPPAQNTAAKATPTSSKVLVNGNATNFDAYNINDNNYFKLRDVAKVVSSSEKQFEVSWDASKNAISLISGQQYTAVGGELEKGDGTAKNAVSSNSTIYKDGTVISLTAYNINGNNYFKLRDLGQAFNFGVDWDGASNAVVIDTSTAYTAE
ncbi:MAG: stalk domain-containing protein [Eubacteriales bacterium]|nr:stalk domain-containing protein [Eubacteriales bacterium]MDD4390460.1 stalk domain-containing protein [Eubacteriales bacterium]